uniref:Uncharacterized protein n=1 Tax=Desertifilum tharense IPPAS B-1220 TaxID=1781255 RepID=A0A1E5QPF2_9CYAN|nr:hypothetical protein BH720_04125 [Desertifilum tharense IPPAS B-1220]
MLRIYADSVEIDRRFGNKSANAAVSGGLAKKNSNNFYGSIKFFSFFNIPSWFFQNPHRLGLGIPSGNSRLRNAKFHKEVLKATVKLYNLGLE